LKLLLDVVAVKVHGQRLVRAPFELTTSFCLTRMSRIVVGDAAVRNGQRVGHLAASAAMVSALLNDNASIDARSRGKEHMVARRVIHYPGGRSAMRLSIQPDS